MSEETDEVWAALEQCQHALAALVRPRDGISGLDITTAYATCIEAETRARVVIATRRAKEMES